MLFISPPQLISHGTTIYHKFNTYTPLHTDIPSRFASTKIITTIPFILYIFLSQQPVALQSQHLTVKRNSRIHFTVFQASHAGNLILRTVNDDGLQFIGHLQLVIRGFHRPIVLHGCIPNPKYLRPSSALPYNSVHLTFPQISDWISKKDEPELLRKECPCFRCPNLFHHPMRRLYLNPTSRLSQ